MKPRFTFQTLILAVLAPVLAAFTALWAWQLYQSTQRVILDGFDRKLLGIAESVGALTDGDGHREYQQRRHVVALAARAGGDLVGFDASTPGFVAVSPVTGGARTLGRTGGAMFRSLAWLPGASAGYALAADGGKLAEIGSGTAQVARRVALSQPLEGIFAEAGGLAGWRGTAVFRIDPAGGEVAPRGFAFPEALRAVAADPATSRLYGLSQDGSALLVLDASGRPIRKVALFSESGEPAAGATPPAERLPPPPLLALACIGGRVFAAGPSLVGIDPQSGLVGRAEYTTGYFDVEDPFYRRNRAAFISLQKATGLTYLYTQVYLGGKKIYYILDGTTTADYSPPGSGDEVPPATVDGAERVQFIGRSWVSPIQRWATWGLLKSCFTPVRDSAGKVVAMAGADVDITIIRAKSRWALFAALVIGAASLVAAGIVSFRVARALTRPLQQLKESALWIAAGYYGAEIKVAGTREIAALAATLDRLRRRLDEDGRRVQDWREEIRVQREQTALAQTLDQAMSDTVGTSSASCRHRADVVWWQARPEPDAVSAACLRARLVLLASELFGTGRAPAELPGLLLASAPDLIASASWQEGTRTLHFQAIAPITVRIDGAIHQLQGSGALRLLRCESLEWLVPDPAPAAAAANR